MDTEYYEDIIIGGGKAGKTLAPALVADREMSLQGRHLLVAVGRAPTTDTLNLAAVELTLKQLTIKKKNSDRSMLILLVEDDPAQLEPLRAALSKAGHIVDAIEDGETAQWLLSQKDYDLLILDWMLPHVSGVQLCQEYRQAGKTSPVLILTAKDTTSDKVTGLDAGADDYLVKPIDVMELLARVRALARRSPFWQGDILSLEDLHLNLNNLTIERNQVTVQLSGREFQLMEYLMRHPRQVLSHNQIEQALWGWGAEPESNAVTTLVRRLRQRLQTVGAKDWVENVYGMGYRFDVPKNVNLRPDE